MTRLVMLLLNYQKPMKTPKINIEDYAGWEDSPCTYTASNAQKYDFNVYRPSYSVAWYCQVTGEGSPMCHHPDPHATAAGAKRNGRKFVEAAIKERGGLNVRA